MDIKELSEGIIKLSEEATAFFDAAFVECGEEEEPSQYWFYCGERRNAYWDKLTNENRQLSQKAQETLLKVVPIDGR
ncbi:hypothetical protein [Methylomonas sp. MgM2]